MNTEKLNNDDLKDRILDHALREVVGNETPPDLSDRILRAATGDHAQQQTSLAPGADAMATQTTNDSLRRKFWAVLTVAASVLIGSVLIFPEFRGVELGVYNSPGEKLMEQKTSAKAGSTIKPDVDADFDEQDGSALSALPGTTSEPRNSTQEWDASMGRQKKKDSGVELPEIDVISIEKTFEVSDRGTVLSGGLKRPSDSGSPINDKLMMGVTPHIIIQEEEERLGITDGDADTPYIERKFRNTGRPGVTVQDSAPATAAPTSEMGLQGLISDADGKLPQQESAPIASNDKSALPSPYYLSDDVQFVVPGQEFKLAKEAAEPPVSQRAESGNQSKSDQQASNVPSSEPVTFDFSMGFGRSGGVGGGSPSEAKGDSWGYQNYAPNPILAGQRFRIDTSPGQEVNRYFSELSSIDAKAAQSADGLDAGYALHARGAKDKQELVAKHSEVARQLREKTARYHALNAEIGGVSSPASNPQITSHLNDIRQIQEQIIKQKEKLVDLNVNLELVRRQTGSSSAIEEAVAEKLEQNATLKNYQTEGLAVKEHIRTLSGSEDEEDSKRRAQLEASLQALQQEAYKYRTQVEQEIRKELETKPNLNLDVAMTEFALARNSTERKIAELDKQYEEKVASLEQLGETDGKLPLLGAEIEQLQAIESQLEYKLRSEQLKRRKQLGDIALRLSKKVAKYRNLSARMDRDFYAIAGIVSADPNYGDLEKEIQQLQQQLGRGPDASGDKYARLHDNPFVKAVGEKAVSTFSIDVDTASYANVRQMISQSGHLPPADAVRIEELVNYFDYNYTPPTDDTPFASHVEVAGCPWKAGHRLVRVGIKGRELQTDNRPQSNLVFLIDVSGSMNEPAKLPLLVEGMKMLTRELGENDRIAIVVYASSEGLALPSTRGDQQDTILSALENLRAGGSTAGGAGIQLAYEIAEKHFIKGGVNRIILATDGDFNVGTTSTAALETMAEEKAKASGVFMTVLGFGRGNLRDELMEAISNKGNGNYHYIDNTTEARKVLVAEMAGTLVTIAKDVKIQVEFNPSEVSAYRLIGYENRMLRTEDFNDDTKDAGEIGAGHTVTAIYEVVPAGMNIETPGVDPLKYQQSAAKPTSDADASDELLTLKIRYKQPDGDTSTKLAFPITDEGQSFAKATDDFKFASAVASFAMLLRHSQHQGITSYSAVEEIAQDGMGKDKHGYRAEFLQLVRQAKQLAGE